jgi:hypothetical protein
VSLSTRLIIFFLDFNIIALVKIELATKCPSIQMIVGINAIYMPLTVNHKTGPKVQ